MFIDDGHFTHSKGLPDHSLRHPQSRVNFEKLYAVDKGDIDSIVSLCCGVLILHCIHTIDAIDKALIHCKD